MDRTDRYFQNHFTLEPRVVIKKPSISSDISLPMVKTEAKAEARMYVDCGWCEYNVREE